MRKNRLNELPKYMDLLMTEKNRKFMVMNGKNDLKKKFSNKEMFMKTDKIYRAK